MPFQVIDSGHESVTISEESPVSEPEREKVSTTAASRTPPPSRTEQKAPEKRYTAFEVRDLEARIASKQRALASNAKMLQTMSLPDGGAKLRKSIESIKVRRVCCWSR